MLNWLYVGGGTIIFIPAVVLERTVLDVSRASAEKTWVLLAVCGRGVHSTQELSWHGMAWHGLAWLPSHLGAAGTSGSPLGRTGVHPCRICEEVGVARYS